MIRNPRSLFNAFRRLPPLYEQNSNNKILLTMTIIIAATLEPRVDIQNQPLDTASNPSSTCPIDLNPGYSMTQLSSKDYHCQVTHCTHPICHPNHIIHDIFSSPSPIATKIGAV